MLSAERDTIKASLHSQLAQADSLRSHGAMHFSTNELQVLSAISGSEACECLQSALKAPLFSNLFDGQNSFQAAC